MALRSTFLLLLIAAAFVAEASVGPIATDALTSFAAEDFNGVEEALVGDLIGDEEVEMDSEVARRELRRRGGSFISYGALSKNKVPCSRRGTSYYNCRAHKQANPYHRGCSVITRCARNTR